MEGGRGGRRAASSTSGCSWAAFEETAKDYELRSSLLSSSRNPFSPTARQLCREDMAIYGVEPASDSLALVVCEQCGRVVKSQALSKHKDLYHSKVLHIPPPKHIQHVHTVAQPSSAMTTDESRGQFPHPGNPHLTNINRGGGPSSGGGGVMGFAATELPRQNSSGDVADGNRAGERHGDGSIATKTSREYDPNRHCGVWVEEEQKHCTRSLTCKNHPLSQRRKVLGRSRPFNDLLEDHRRKKKLKKQGKLTGGHTPSLLQPSPSDPPPLMAHPLYPTPLPPHDPSSPPPHLTTSTGMEMESRGEWEAREDPSDDEELIDRGLPSRPEYPAPLAACSFGSRSTKCGSLIFSHRSDRLRSALATLGGRTKDFTETTLHRKHSYSALLQQRKARKYLSHTDVFSQERPTLRSVVAPNMTSTFTPPLTIHTSPLSLSPPSSQLPTPITSRSFPSNTSGIPALSLATPGEVLLRNSTTEEPEPPTMNGTSEDTSITDTNLEDSTDRDKERRGRDRSGRKRARRGRRKHRRTATDKNSSALVAEGTAGDGVGSNEEQIEEPIHNHIHHVPPEAATVAIATRGDGMGVANLPPTSRVAPESRVPDRTRVDGQGPGRDRGKGGGSVSDFRMVKIKEEPRDDMESEHHHVHAPHKTPTSKPHSLLPNGVVMPTHSPIRTFNAASTSRGSPQTFVINPSGQHPSGGHPMVTSLSPRMSGLLPIRGPLQQQHPTSQPPTNQQTYTFGHSLQGLPMQMLNDTLQRRMMQQSTRFWLGGGALGANSILPDTTRQLVLQQQQSHGQSPQMGAGSGEVGVPRQNLVGSPILHSLNSNPNFPQPLGNQSHQAQLLSMQRGSAVTSGRVRTPISPIPSGIPLHEALQRNLPPPGSGGLTLQPSLFAPSALHAKQSLEPSQLPSQQVT